MGRCLAVGDSTLADPRSWAWWLCGATGDDLEVVARGGSRVADVLTSQLPALDGRYDRAFCSIGGNDVGFGDWDPLRYREGLREICTALAGHADTVVVSTLPSTLRHPANAGSAREARERARAVSAAIRSVEGVIVVPVEDLTGRRYFRADLLHLTDAGQAAAADRAAGLLGESVTPSTTRAVEPGPSASDYWWVRARAQAGRTARRVGLRRGA